MTICPYCGAEFPPAKHGRHDKRFCTTAHKHGWRLAVNHLGELIASTMTPGQLRDWFIAQSSRATAPVGEPILRGTTEPPGAADV